MKLRRFSIGCLGAVLSLGERYPHAPLFGGVLQSLLSARLLGQGERAIKRRDYESALHVLRRVEPFDGEDNWTSSAKYHLGLLYWNGWGTTTDRKRAVAIFQDAAMAGDVSAIDFLKRRAHYVRAGISEDELVNTT